MKARFDKRSPKLIQKSLDILNDSQSLEGYITENYTRNDRPFFSKRDSVRIDGICNRISRTDYASKGSLVNSCLRYANVLGSFNTALASRHLEKNINLPPLYLSPVPRITVNPSCKVHITCKDVLTFHEHEYVDLVYLDPPYTTNSFYAREYHLLETIARNDRPVLRGQYNIRDDIHNSPFAKKTTALEAFDILFSKLRCKYVCMSYGNYGIVSLRDIKKLLRSHGFGRIKVFSTVIDKYLNHTLEEREKVSEILIIAANIES
jgi:adenine-specific DNA-methyltransferase